MKSSAAAAGSEVLDALVLNALIRCTREDSSAAPLFERIEGVPGLWVLELEVEREEFWADLVTRILQLLSVNASVFNALKEGSADYTLHVTVAMSELRPVIVPPSLSCILGGCGIALELYWGGP